MKRTRGGSVAEVQMRSRVVSDGWRDGGMQRRSANVCAHETPPGCMKDFASRTSHCSSGGATSSTSTTTTKTMTTTTTTTLRGERRPFHRTYAYVSLGSILFILVSEPLTEEAPAEVSMAGKEVGNEEIKEGEGGEANFSSDGNHQLVFLYSSTTLTSRLKMSGRRSRVSAGNCVADLKRAGF